MRLALFIDEEDIAAIRTYLENKYNGEVTTAQVEAYIDELVKQRVKEIKDDDSRRIHTVGP